MITKKKLVNYLQGRNLYEECDEWIVDQFIFNLKKLNAVTKEMNKKDYSEMVFGGGKNPDYKIQNPLNFSYDKYFNRLLDLAKLFGLSAKDRKEIIKDAVSVNKDMEEFLND